MSKPLKRTFLGFPLAMNKTMPRDEVWAVGADGKIIAILKMARDLKERK